MVFAARLHADQTRKGSEVPYLSHLMGVTAIALEHGANEDEAIGALLHDAVEDRGGQATLQEIRRRFGNHVADIVEGCSDTDVVPKPPWRQRKERYLAHLPHASPSVRLVSASDKLHNARTILSDFHRIGDAVWDRFKGGKQGTLWYYRSLVDIFSSTGPHALADELARVVRELENLAGAS